MVHISDPVSALTAGQYAYIQKGFQYRFLADGAFLISIPSPEGYIYWNHTGKFFTREASEMLNALKIPLIKK